MFTFIKDWSEGFPNMVLSTEYSEAVNTRYTFQPLRVSGNSHRVAKFAGFVSLFISFYSQINSFFAEFIIVFCCPTSWVILNN